jgi:hypothetical protein
VPEVLAERLDRFALVQGCAGIEVAEGVAAVGSARFHIDPREGLLPEERVEVVAVQGFPLPRVDQEWHGDWLSVGLVPRERDLDRGPAGHVGVDRLEHGVRQRHVARLPALRQAEDLLVRGQQLHLPADVHLATFEVDVVGRQAEDLPLAQAEAGTEPNDQLILLGKFIPYGEYALLRPRDDLASVYLGPSYRLRATGVGNDQGIIDCRGEDG